MRALVLGATGYSGMMIARLLVRHPDVRDCIPVSHSRSGTLVAEAYPWLSAEGSEKMPKDGRLVAPDRIDDRHVDVVFAALPHLRSIDACRRFIGRAVIIDLSADLRVPDVALFTRAYGSAPPASDLLSMATYGLSEIYDEAIRHADLIANPGCYPTAALLALVPLVRAGLLRGTINVMAMSGISGGGRGANVDLLFAERSENVNAYAPGTRHRHWAEMHHYLNREGDRELDIRFVPHLVPMVQGLAVTAFCRVRSNITDDDVAACYERAYINRPCVRRSPRPIPETRDVRNTNRCDYNWYLEDDRLYLFSVIDNLIKGAAGQAIQNMNVRFGLAETAGLPMEGES